MRELEIKSWMQQGRRGDSIESFEDGVELAQEIIDQEQWDQAA